MKMPGVTPYLLHTMRRRPSLTGAGMREGGAEGPLNSADIAAVHVTRMH